MSLVKIINIIINPIIIAGGIFVLIELIYSSSKLKNHAKTVAEKLFAMKSVGMRQSKALDLQQRALAVVRREDLYPLKKEYNELISAYATWVQMIPIFPLLGILGTVSGLIVQVQAADAAAIYESLHVALSSTLYGLIAAIILKIVEVALVQKHINMIESMFSDYEIKYQDQRDLSKNAEAEN